MARDSKTLGAYFTPEAVAAALVRWAVRSPADRLLDPSSGDGRFIALHPHSVGVERDPASVAEAASRAPHATVVEADFFTWAADDKRRFDCAAGNPPFIRYQRFTGTTRWAALDYCRRLGVTFSGLSSSWAPFIVAAASKLRPGGRIAFVVPAEIGHAPYAVPLVEYLVSHFGTVQVVAIKEKVFPRLSEDCWLLFADNAGCRTENILLSRIQRFVPGANLPPVAEQVPVDAWRTRWRGRLRPFLLPRHVRCTYERMAADSGAVRLGQIAQVGIGYVSGANSFFHLRPSEAERFRIPDEFLVPSIRNSRYVTGAAIDDADVGRWIARDEPVFLLRIPPRAEVPGAVRAYLDTAEGRRAKATYKCRNRTPWYTVPDVRRPEFVLTYMSGKSPALAVNRGRCTCTNALLAIDLRSGLFDGDPALSGDRLSTVWSSAAGRLSCELEGHPLGGGMLKLEPGEARNVLLTPDKGINGRDGELLQEGIDVMRQWRHVA
jgi:hypothetical protein